jgi:hypothetical protein
MTIALCMIVEPLMDQNRRLFDIEEEILQWLSNTVFS